MTFPKYKSVAGKSGWKRYWKGDKNCQNKLPKQTGFCFDTTTNGLWQLVVRTPTKCLRIFGTQSVPQIEMVFQKCTHVFWHRYDNLSSVLSCQAGVTVTVTKWKVVCVGEYRRYFSSFFLSSDLFQKMWLNCVFAHGDFFNYWNFQVEIWGTQNRGYAICVRVPFDLGHKLPSLLSCCIHRYCTSRFQKKNIYKI